MAPPKPACPQSLLSWHGDLIKIECAAGSLPIKACGQSLLSDLKVPSDSFPLMMLDAQIRCAQVRMSQINFFPFTHTLLNKTLKQSFLCKYKRLSFIFRFLPPTWILRKNTWKVLVHEGDIILFQFLSGWRESLTDSPWQNQNSALKSQELVHISVGKHLCSYIREFTTAFSLSKLKALIAQSLSCNCMYKL